MDRLYCIYDDLAKTAGPIFQARNMDVAKRFIDKLLKDNPINLSEYTLIDLGSFDTETGTIFADIPSHFKLDSLYSVDFPKEDSKEFNNYINNGEFV